MARDPHPSSRTHGTKGWGSFSQVILLPLFAIVSRSRAQSSVDLGAESHTKMTSSHFSATNSFTRSTTVISTPSILPNTTSSLNTEPTEQPPTDLFPAASSSSDDDSRSDSAFNYYFLFLAAFGVGLAVLLWWIHQRKRRRKEQLRLSGQHALARDLEGWAGTRRFMNGRYGRTYATVVDQREEGLNERGEAPPPYQPKSETAVADTSIQITGDASNRVSIPLRTLARKESDRVPPPNYHTAPFTNPKP